MVLWVLQISNVLYSQAYSPHPYCPSLCTSERGEDAASGPSVCHKIIRVVLELFPLLAVVEPVSRFPTNTHLVTVSCLCISDSWPDRGVRIYWGRKPITYLLKSSLELSSRRPARRNPTSRTKRPDTPHRKSSSSLSASFTKLCRTQILLQRIRTRLKHTAPPKTPIILRPHMLSSFVSGLYSQCPELHAPFRSVPSRQRM